MGDFHNHRTIKATRKRHVCEQCGKWIEAGSPAEYETGSYFGEFYSGHQHVECRAAGIAYAEMSGCWGEDFMWFQHQLEDPDDKAWLLEHHPVVAERLGLEHEVAE